MTTPVAAFAASTLARAADPVVAALRAELEELAAGRRPPGIARVRQAVWALLDAYPADAAAKLAVVRGLDELAAYAAASDLVRLQGLLEALIHHAPASLAYVDRDLVFRWNNQTHCDTLGRRREEIIGQSAFVAAKGIVSRTERVVRAALEHGEFGQIRGIPIQHRTRQVLTHWDLSYVPVPGEDGRPEGVLIVGAEVTDRVAVEAFQAERIERLEALDRLKDQFLAIVSHELRTPINAILGFGSVLEDGVAGPLTAEQGQLVGKVLKAGDGLLALIDDLLDMSRMRAGRFTINLEPVAVPQLLERGLEPVRLLAERAGHALAVELPIDLPVLRADAQRVGQVLSNLVSNAVKFSPPGGAIVVAVERVAGALRFGVRDRGPGIPEADRERVFEPFVQLDGSATRARGGAGLGLAICKGLVEAHGGRMGVEGAPGGGSLFWFELPTL